MIERKASRVDCGSGGGAGALLAGLLVLLAACRRASPPSPPPPPPVVLVTIDTLRADHLSCYGYPRATSAHLDRFLARGTRFEWALAASPSTAPSHASIFTGRYPSFHSVGLRNGGFRLRPEETTLAEVCSRLGMATAAVVSNPVLNRDLGLDQGFDVYDDRIEGRERNRDFPYRRAKEAVDRAIALLRRLEGKPFFLWLHLQDPHGPYVPPGWREDPWGAPPPCPPGAQAGRKLLPGGDDVGFERIPRYQLLPGVDRVSGYVDRYDAEIRAMDAELGRFFEALEGAGVPQRGLVAITADHGEAFGEEGFFFSHGHSVSLDQVRVPLGFVGRGVRPGVVIREPVSHIDVFATLLDFLGADMPLEPPPLGPARSASLLEALRSGRLASPPPVYTESLTQRGAAEGMRYVRRNRLPPPDPSMAPAPGATDWRKVRFGQGTLDLATGAPVKGEAARPAEAAMEGFFPGAEGSLRRRDAARLEAGRITPEQRRRLEALGYTGDR